MELQDLIEPLPSWAAPKPLQPTSDAGEGS